MTRRIGLLIACVSLLSLAAADPDAATQPAERTWSIGTFTGPADQVARQFNAQIEEAWSHLQRAKEAVRHNEWQTQQFIDAVLAVERTKPEYVALVAERDRAKRALDQARAASDVNGALDAGSRYNGVRDEIKKLEDAATGNDVYVTNEIASKRHLDAAVVDADKALTQVAKWRSKTLMAFRNGYAPQWPVRRNDEVLLLDAVVHSVSRQSVVLMVPAQEETGYQKNFSGDGVGLATYAIHPFELEIPKPPGFNRAKGQQLDASNCYFIGARMGRDLVDEGVVPRFSGTVSTDGPLCRVLQKLSDVRGPPKEFLAGIDRVVNAELDKQIKDAEAKHNLPGADDTGGNRGRGR